MQNLLPEGHCPDPFERTIVELGPRQVVRVEPLMAVDELPAKRPLMRLRPDPHHGAITAIC
jgi:hypothetical protein